MVMSVPTERVSVRVVPDTLPPVTTPSAVPPPMPEPGSTCSTIIWKSPEPLVSWAAIRMLLFAPSLFVATEIERFAPIGIVLWFAVVCVPSGVDGLLRRKQASHGYCCRADSTLTVARTFDIDPHISGCGAINARAKLLEVRRQLLSAGVQFGDCVSTTSPGRQTGNSDVRPD